MEYSRIIHEGYRRGKKRESEKKTNAMRVLISCARFGFAQSDALTIFVCNALVDDFDLKHDIVAR